MDAKTKDVLQDMIKKNRLSSGMDDDSVWYAFKDKNSGNNVVLVCQHAYNTSNEIFTNYSITINSILVEDETLPTLKSMNSKKTKPNIIQVMDMCAEKVIQQQKQMQNLRFLVINNNYKYYS